MFNKQNFVSSLDKMILNYTKYIVKMSEYPHNSEKCALEYIKLFKHLSNNNDSAGINNRFYKHPLKTIKSLFTI